MRPPNQKAALTAAAVTKLAAMRRARRTYKVCHWPGSPELVFKLGLLSRAELQESQAAAHLRFARDLGLEPNETVNIGAFQEEVMVQVLHRACRDVERPDEETFAPSADDIRENTAADEQALVWQMYLDHQAEVDPGGTQMTPELHAEIEALVKKKAESLLSGFGGRVLASYLCSSASPPSP